MLFNFDSFQLVAVAFVVSGIFIFSFYKGSTMQNKDSLVNTNSSLDSISKLDSNVQLNNLSNLDYVEVGVQTANISVDASIQANTTYANTGMQTSARMWLESIRNWIDEILGTGTTPNPNPNYVDVGVQTNATNTWAIVKQWFFDVCSMRSSELSSIGNNKVTKWITKLESDQSIDLHVSESSLTNLKFGSDSDLQKLVNPDDSASQISEVISEANLQNVAGAADANRVRVYDMNNSADVLDLMNDPTVVYSINPATLPGDDLITFYTADSTNEILRSTLETLLTSVN